MEEIELVDGENVFENASYDVSINCPKCGVEYFEYNIEFEKDYICECEECGHKFKFNYCPY